MDPDNPIYARRISKIYEGYARLNELDALYEFCDSHGRQPDEEESRNIRALVSGIGDDGAHVMEALMLDIRNARSSEDADRALDKIETALPGFISGSESDIAKYDPA